MFPNCPRTQRPSPHFKPGEVVAVQKELGALHRLVVELYQQRNLATHNMLHIVLVAELAIV